MGKANRPRKNLPFMRLTGANLRFGGVTGFHPRHSGTISLLGTGPGRACLNFYGDSVPAISGRLRRQAADGAVGRRHRCAVGGGRLASGDEAVLPGRALRGGGAGSGGTAAGADRHGGLALLPPPDRRGPLGCRRGGGDRGGHDRGRGGAIPLRRRAHDSMVAGAGAVGGDGGGGLLQQRLLLPWQTADGGADGDAMHGDPLAAADPLQAGAFVHLRGDHGQARAAHCRRPQRVDGRYRRSRDGRPLQPGHQPAQLPALPDRADVPPDLGPFRQAVRAGQHV